MQFDILFSADAQLLGGQHGHHALKSDLTMNIFEVLNKHGSELTEDQKRQIEAKLTSMMQYKAKIGVLGKTGAGKSSLCNALFGQEICPVSDVEACTRATQDVLLEIGRNQGITLVDVPGVGESGERDKEYEALYRELLPQLDAILWVLKADDRAYSVDIDFYKSLVKPYLDAGVPFIVVLNQADKIEPFREWQVEDRRPGPKQALNLEAKVAAVAASFGLKQSLIIPVSAEEKYGLSRLVDELIFSLPDEKKAAVFDKVPEENRSEAATAEVKGSFMRTIQSVISGATEGAAIGGRFGGKAGAIAGAIVGGLARIFRLW
jgi:small GTP-binding protein